MTAKTEKLDAAGAAARQFMETWEGVGQLLGEATSDELRTILQHYIEVIEFRPSPEDPKRGTYAFRLLPEVRPLGDQSVTPQ